MSEINIALDDPLKPEILALLERHHAFTKANSPPGGCYAFNANELSDPNILFWSARREGEPVGCIALYLREDGFGEIKSLHVRDTERGSGLGATLVELILKTAKDKGLTKLGLETGHSDGFGPSRRLYERHGFVHGPVFSPYEEGTFSYCMTRDV